MGGRAADRRLRGLVRMPTSRATSSGDHTIFIGEVATCERAKGDGLVFHHGKFGSAVPVPEP